MTQQNDTGIFPTAVHALLQQFTGTWHTSGSFLTEEGTKLAIKGTDIYEWMPGKHFLLHHVNVLMGKDRKQSLEVIGVDAATGGYPMHSFDSEGNAVKMMARCDGDRWTFQGDSLRFAGGFFKEGELLQGQWEQLVQGRWQHLMDITLEKEKHKNS